MNLANKLNLAGVMLPVRWGVGDTPAVGHSKPRNASENLSIGFDAERPLAPVFCPQGAVRNAALRESNIMPASA